MMKIFKFILGGILTFSSMFAFSLNVYAKDISLDEPKLAATNSILEANPNDPDDIRLYNATNTYKYVLESGENTVGWRFNNKLRYYVGTELKTERNINSKKKITVFTHGWCSSEEAFIGKDAKEKNTSLVKALLGINYDKVIVIKMKKKQGTIAIEGLDTLSYRYELGNQSVLYDETGAEVNRAITDSSEYTGNIALVFGGWNTGKENDFIYGQFNYMMSYVLYYYYQNNGYFPKIDLIGHSRGGVTNLQYAMDHPDFIQNVISIGTPYLGTVYTDAAIESMNLMHPLGKKGFADMNKTETYASYCYSWNMNYQLYKKSFKVYAFGGYKSFSNLDDGDGAVPLASQLGSDVLTYLGFIKNYLFLDDSSLHAHGNETTNSRFVKEAKRILAKSTC